jgi:hypothetical protein
MIAVVRIYVGFMALALGALGALALVAPDTLMAQLDLLPKSLKGVAEIRALYGGAFLSWGVMLLIAALPGRALGQGFRVAMALTLGGIAAARVVSLAIEHQLAFNVQALVSEGLIAAGCWALYRHEKGRAQKA